MQNGISLFTFKGKPAQVCRSIKFLCDKEGDRILKEIAPKDWQK